MQDQPKQSSDEGRPHGRWKPTSSSAPPSASASPSPISERKYGSAPDTRIFQDDAIEPHAISSDSSPYTASPHAKNRKIYVTRLPSKIQSSQLTDLFENVAPVQRVFIKPEIRTGTVLYENAEDAAKAIAMFDGYEWHGNSISVSTTPTVSGKSLWIGNIPFSATWRDIRRYLEDEHGFLSVRRVEVAVDIRTGRSRGYATATFDSEHDAARCAKLLNGIVFEGRTLTVREDREEGRFSSSSHSVPATPPPSYALPVGGHTVPPSAIIGGLVAGQTPPGTPPTSGYVYGMAASSMPQSFPVGHTGPPPGDERYGYMMGYPGLQQAAQEHAIGPSAASYYPSYAVPGHSLAVENLSPNCLPKELSSLIRSLVPSDSAIKLIDFLKTPEGRSTGNAIVVFDSPEIAREARRRLQGLEFQGRSLVVRSPRYPSGPTRSSETLPHASSRTLTVRNLPENTHVEDLANLFKSLNLRISRIDLSQTQAMSPSSDSPTSASPTSTQSSSGSTTVRESRATIKFASRGDAERAIQQIDEIEFKGRRLSAGPVNT